MLTVPRRDATVELTVQTVRKHLEMLASQLLTLASATGEPA